MDENEANLPSLSTAPTVITSSASDGKVICFFKPKSKFKVRYSTFEFDTAATLDDGAVWATAFAVHLEMTDADEAMLAALVTKAAAG